MAIKFFIQIPEDVEVEPVILPILAFPFIQFGLSWWVNVGSLGCLILILASIRNLKKWPFRVDGFTISILLLMAVVFIWQDFGDLHSFLRISREALVFFLLFFFNQRDKSLITVKSTSNLDKALLGVIVIEFVLVIVQLFSLQRGVWVGPNADWLAGRGNLIPTALDLQYSKLRPSGTFSEPSYLGVVCLSVLVLISSQPLQTFNRKVTYFLSIFTIVLCQSKSALFFGILILVIQGMRNQKLRQGRVENFALPIFILCIFPLWSVIGGTIESSRSSISIQNRIFDPLTYSANFMLEHPLGVSFYERISSLVDSNIGLTWGAISHNSFFNFMFSYGFVGVLIFLRILYLARGDLISLIYLFALLLQNGGFLDFDKLFLITVVLIIHQNGLLKLDPIHEPPRD